jgi:hypothetical protein
MTREEEATIGDIQEGPLYEEILEALETTILEETEEDEDIDPEQVSEMTSEMMTDLIEDLAEERFEEVMESLEDGLSRWRENMSGFESRLSETWGDAFDLLEAFIIYNYEVGNEFVRHTREGIDEDNHVYGACKILHSRALQVSREILTLMRNGYVDGALARWRTLDEITVASIFIRENGNETAKRFINHRVYDDEFLARLIDDYGSQIGESITGEELEQLEEMLEELQDKHEGFSDLVGWAAEDVEERATWLQLHKETGLGHLLPYYSYASTNVHASSKGTQHFSGTPNVEGMSQEPFRFGPTNSGFGLPAELTMISLSGATMSLVLTRPMLDIMVDLFVMYNHSFDRIRQEFAECQEYIDEKERERREWWKDYLEDAEPEDLINDFNLDEDFFE